MKRIRIEQKALEKLWNSEESEMNRFALHCNGKASNRTDAEL